jgi:hypothetical protein
VGSAAELQPDGEIVKFPLDPIPDLRAERQVLMDGVHHQPTSLAVRERVQLADEPVAGEDRQREVPQRRCAAGRDISVTYLKPKSACPRTRSWISRSNGERSAVLPSQGRSSASGSTRQLPGTPSTVVG